MAPMKGALTTVCVAFAVVLVTGCGGGGGGSNVNTPTTTTASLQGYVYTEPVSHLAQHDALTLHVAGSRPATASVPVAGATVAIDALHASTTTNALGFFRMENLTPGTYTVTIVHKSYRDALAVPVTIMENSTASINSTLGVTYAVLIGIGQYQNLNNLEGPPNDVRDIAAALLGFHGNRQELVDRAATKMAIQQAITSVASSMTANDYLLLYYSGHGGSNKLSNGGWIDYICPTDMQMNNYDSIITDRELKEWLSAIPDPRHAIVILDSCFAGAFFDGKAGMSVTRSDYAPVYRSLSKIGCTVLAASAPDEFSWEQDGHGIFTQALTDGINYDKTHVDGNGDHVITTSELFNYAYQKTLEREPSQHPTLQVGADPVLVRY